MITSILDCTLRDGGYINDFQFGEKNIRHIMDKLCEANIDIIECGFLRTNKNNPDCSLYGGVEQIKLPIEREGKMFVAMIEYGGISADDITVHKPEYIDGIRLTFHNNEWKNTKVLAQNLMNKGYKIFIQPVGTVTYSKDELYELISEVNELSPFAFYFVDTFGSIFKKDLHNFFKLIDNRLSKDIAFGFHPHNNLQLSFANAMDLLELETERHIIIDSSVFGMGRGAGNLPTELVAHYININSNKKYNSIPLLELIDDVILPIFYKSAWGYSTPYYLAAIRGVHPNYATFLINKSQITIPQTDDILSKISPETKHLFRPTDIELLYYNEMRADIDDTDTIIKLRTMIGDNPVLVITPGNTVKLFTDQLLKFIRTNNAFVITVNFIPDDIKPDLIFCGNNKRFLSIGKYTVPFVVSSNIKYVSEDTMVVNYDSLISTKRKDNSGIMILRLLVRLGIKAVTLAGYDGFVSGGSYYSDNYETHIPKEEMQTMNIDMAIQLGELSGSLDIDYLTPTMYK